MKEKNEWPEAFVWAVFFICAAVLISQFIGCSKEAMKQESIERMAKEAKP